MIIATQHYINVLNYLMKFNLNKLINYQRKWMVFIRVLGKGIASKLSILSP